MPNLPRPLLGFDATAFLAALVLATVASSDEAGAQALDIDDTGMTKGQWEIKAVNLVNAGFPRGTVGASRSSHEQLVGYGFTDRFKAALHADFEGIVRDGLRPDHVALETQVALLDAETGGVGLDWFTSVQAVTHEDATNSLFFGPIVRLQQGKLSATFNPYFERTFGQNSTPGINLNYGWRVMRELEGGYAIALEGYGRIPDLANAPDLAEQDHRLGGALYKTIEVSKGSELAITLGALAGLTRDTPDVSTRLAVGLTF